MSKIKSKFDAKFKNTLTPQVWCVDVYEHEKEMGERLEDHFEFPNEKESKIYAQEANVRFLKQGDSDSFTLAHSPYKKK